MLDGYQDGVWFVDLSPLVDPALVTQAIASALIVQEQPGRALLDTLLDYLQTKELLLILDNCEQFVSACAGLVETLLNACPHIQVLATSRERLNLAGETVWLVPVLSLPSVDESDWTDASHSEAVHLFVERAVSALPTFALSQQNAPHVAQICHHLDGIPLAIELAAARIKLLTPAQIAARLDDAFRLLTRGGHDAPPRQQTLRAAMDWSYDMLSWQEQVLFRRLSVFAGGFTLESAEQVCADDERQMTNDESKSLGNQGHSSSVLRQSEILDLLSDLVDKSLVVLMLWEEGEQVRYRMLEPVRRYAGEKLADLGEASMVSGQHLSHFTGLAERAEHHLYGADQRVWLIRLEREHDNIREALKWAIGIGGDSDLALRLAADVWHFWEVRGHLTEGRRWLQVLVEKETKLLHARSKALSGLGTFIWLQGDFSQATMYHEEALSLYRQLNDAHGIAFSLNNLGVQAGNQGDIERAESFLSESLRVARAHDDKLIMAYALNNLGNAAEFRNELERAAELFQASLDLYETLGAKYDNCQALDSLARVAYLREDYDTAVDLFRRSMVLAIELESRAFVAERLDGLARVAMARTNSAQAVVLFGAADAVRRVIGATVSLVYQTENDRNLLALREQLGQAEFGTAWQAGNNLTMTQAIEYALNRTAG